jgi:hypothetical protein
VPTITWNEWMLGKVKKQPNSDKFGQTHGEQRKNSKNNKYYKTYFVKTLIQAASYFD